MAKFTSSLFAFSAGLVALKQAQAGVTIYQPVPTDSALLGPLNIPEIIGVSAIGTASGGATQYVATEVASAFTAEGTTLTFSPTTYVVTFEEGASTANIAQAITTTIAGHAVALSGELNCGPGSGNNLNCVDSEQLSVEGSQPTSTSVTFVASKSPIFTITGSTAPLSTAKSGTLRATPFMATTTLLMGLFYTFVYIF